MKRLIALFLALTLAMTGAACAESIRNWGENPLEAAYMEAALLMVAGRHDEAAETFAALSGYSDAPQMAIYCRGLAFAAARDYDAAIAAFTALGDFKDSAVRATWFTGVGAQEKAEAAVVGGTLGDLEAAKACVETAVEAFAALPYLPDAPARLDACRDLKAQLDATLPALRRAHEFDEVGVVNGEYVAVKRDGKWGVLHVSGELTAPCQWDGIAAILDGVAVVDRSVWNSETRRTGWRYGLIDLKGNVLVPCEAQLASGPAGQTVLKCVDGQGETVIYALDGQRLTQEDVGGERTGIAPDRFLQDCGEGWALTDGAGNVLFADAAYAYLITPTPLGNLWLTSRENRSVGLLSADGQMLLPVEYTVPGFSEYLYRGNGDYMVLEAADGTVAAYGADGHKAFDSRWEELTYAGGGLFIVYDAAGMCGAVDAQGQMIVPCRYDEVSVLGGFIVAIVSTTDADEEMGYIFNRKGETLLSGSEEEIEEWSVSVTEDYFIWVDDGLLRIIDQQGETVW